MALETRTGVLQDVSYHMMSGNEVATAARTYKKPAKSCLPRSFVNDERLTVASRTPLMSGFVVPSNPARIIYGTAKRLSGQVQDRFPQLGVVF
jgi:hypothetical protein